MISMIKFLVLIPFLFSCAHHHKKHSDGGLVTVETALFQARSSYLLGCTQARVELKQQDAFNHCSSKADKHLEDLKGIMEQKLE